MNHPVAVTIFGDYFRKIENHIFKHDLVILKEISAIPFYKNHPIFINASCVIFDNCNPHFIYVWLTYKIFPEIKTVYILSQPYQPDIKPHLISFDLYIEPFTIYMPSHYNNYSDIHSDIRNKNHIKILSDSELNSHIEHLYKIPTYYYGNMSDIKTSNTHKLIHVTINLIHGLVHNCISIYNCIPSVSDIFWNIISDDHFEKSHHKTKIHYPLPEFSSNALGNPNSNPIPIPIPICNKEKLSDIFEIKMFLEMCSPYGVILCILLTLYILTK